MPYYSVPRYCGIYYISVGLAHPSWLPQVSLSTLSKIHDTASSTTLTQTFINPSQTSAIAKAKYNFPLYESCAVVSFRCYVGRRLIEGVVKEKTQAKVEFKEAVERGETAGLLEQHTPDVFSTSLGNIPAGETVKVEIEYLIELKHDAEVDGLRFTIPTSIAPRYGDVPSGVSAYNVPGAIEQRGMTISVQLAMPSNIRSVQSPSHNIAMHLGGHVENVPDDAFDPKHALATLSQSSTTLGADFVLLVKCADLSFPRALLETHPTIPDSKALMVTLVPKFTLPPGAKPEIVFVVDRSGSMSHRMEPLRSALGVFLKSLPVGIKFNICSFGSKHSFLWKKSKSYSAESLEEANRHVQSMNADFGGTEILPAIKSTVSQRYVDLPLEVMVLTDGEVWNTEDLFGYVQKATVKGDVRLFSLGIGQDVSHALVEGMARVGRGFAQIVSNEKEGMEGKVVRMLRGGLSAHVNDYRLEWDGKPREVDAGKRKSSSTIGTAVNKMKKKISLFDTSAESEAPVSFSDLPEFVVPKVLQAPYKLPPLFPFSRSTAYVILSGDVSPPSSLWLRGTTPSGDELSLEIPVQVVPGRGQAIHKLAARKILQELEEGTGYIHSGKYGVDKELNPGMFDDWVQREGVRVGVKYGLASKWTSFLAVQKREVATKEEKNSDMDVESVTEVGDDDFEVIMDDEECYDIEEPRKQSIVGQQAMQQQQAGPQMLNAVRPKAAFALLSAPGGGLVPQMTGCVSAAPMAQQLPTIGSARPPPPPAFAKHMGAPLPRPSTDEYSSRPVGFGSEGSMGSMGSFTQSGGGRVNYMSMGGRGGGRVAGKRGGAPGGDRRERRKEAVVMSVNETVSDSEDMAFGLWDEPVVTATEPLSPRKRTMDLIALQTFEGSFPFNAALAALLGTTLENLGGKLKKFVPALTSLSEAQRKSLWATVLAVGMFERKLAVERDVWELVVEKARAWMVGLVGAGYKHVEKSEGLVGEVLGESKA